MRVECTKTKYASQSMADFDIKKISKKSNRATIPIRSYLCHCGSWHLTSRKDFNEEIASLKNQVCELRKENEILKQQNQLLKSNKNKLQNHEVQVEERVQLVYKELSEMKRRFNNLRKDNSELIAKLIQLQK